MLAWATPVVSASVVFVWLTDPDGGVVDWLLTKLARPDTVVVEMGLPLWSPPEDTCYLATYGASRASAQAAAELLGLIPAGGNPPRTRPDPGR
jgi:hypothetical protein